MPKPFVIAKQENSVSLKGTACGPSKLVPAEGRNGAHVKEVSRIEGAVAEEFKDRAVQCIAARLGHDTHLGAGTFAICGGVRVRKHVDFANRIDTQQTPADTSGGYGELARTRIFNAVQQEKVLQWAPPFNGKGISIAGTRPSGLHRAVIDDPGIKGNQVIETPAVEWQVLHFTLVHQSGNGCRGCVHEREFSRNGNLLENFANFEAQVHDGFLPRHEVDPRSERCLETGLFRLHFILAHRQGKDPEVAPLVGGDDAFRPGFKIPHRDHHAGDGRAGRVLDFTRNRGGHLPSHSLWAEQKEQSPHKQTPGHLPAMESYAHTLFPAPFRTWGANP